LRLGFLKPVRDDAAFSQPPNSPPRTGRAAVRPAHVSRPMFRDVSPLPSGPPCKINCGGHPLGLLSKYQTISAFPSVIYFSHRVRVRHILFDKRATARLSCGDTSDGFTVPSPPGPGDDHEIRTAPTPHHWAYWRTDRPLQ